MKLDAYAHQLIEWAKEIVSYLIASGVKPSDAEDVVQDVLLKMLEAEFVIPGNKMRAWMYRVSIRRYIDKYRRDRRYQEILRKDFFQPDELLSFDKEDYDWLWEELKKLKRSDHVVLELHYFQGFSTKEIARILGVSQSKVKVDLMRGRAKLKQILEKAGYKDGNI